MTRNSIAAGVAALLLALAAGGCGCGSEDMIVDAGADESAPDPAEPADAALDEAAVEAPDEELGPDAGDPAPDGEAIPDAAEAEDLPPEELPPVKPPGCIEGSFQPYWGNLHAHTSFSDGEGTPEEAFAYARTVAGLDIQIITDHLEQIYLPTRWADCKEQADDAYLPGTFLAACGYEYGSGFILPLFLSTGHNNVFFNDELFPIVQTDFHDFYGSLVGCATCVASFNHPGDSATQTWSSFEYVPAVDPKMNLFEFNTDGNAWDLFFQALDAGWHISPLYNQDNHSANWGTSNDNRSGFFLAELSRDALHDAMNEHRSFATRDKNASIKLIAQDACWMGSILTGVSSLPPLVFSVEARDADTADGFSAIELYGPRKAPLATIPCAGTSWCEGSWTAPPSAPAYVVAKAVESDGNYLVSAPIWLEP